MVRPWWCLLLLCCLDPDAGLVQYCATHRDCFCVSATECFTLPPFPCSPERSDCAAGYVCAESSRTCAQAFRGQPLSLDPASQTYRLGARVTVSNVRAEPIGVASVQSFAEPGVFSIDASDCDGRVLDVEEACSLSVAVIDPTAHRKKLVLQVVDADGRPAYARVLYDFD